MKLLRALGLAWPVCRCLVCRCNRMIFREVLASMLPGTVLAILLACTRFWWGVDLPMVVRLPLLFAVGWTAGGLAIKRIKAKRRALLDELRGRVEFAP